MRLLLLLVLTTVGCISLSAQYEKGNWYLDAGSGVGYEDSSTEGGNLLQARFRAGYFVRDRLLVGAQYHGTTLYGGDLNDFYDGGALFVRYYLPNLKNTRLAFFGEAALQLGDDDVFSTGLRFGFGAEYALAPGVLLTSTLSGAWGGRRGVVGNLRVGTNYTFGADNQFDDNLTNLNRKGQLMLDSNFGGISTNGQFYTGGNLNLSGGYFLSNSLLLTGALEFSRAGYDLGTDLIPRTLTSTDFALSTGLRYHFNSGKKLQPYLAAGLRYDYSRSVRNVWFDGNEGTGTYSDSGLSGDFRAGVLYNLNPRIALDLGVGYQPLLSGARTVGTNRLNTQLGLKLFLGKQ